MGIVSTFSHALRHFPFGRIVALRIGQFPDLSQSIGQEQGAGHGILGLVLSQCGGEDFEGLISEGVFRLILGKYKSSFVF